ncbi:secreted protein, partial [mine drainage metagenome]
MKFRAWLAIVAGILPLALIAIVAFLAIYSWPAMHFNGFGFVTRDTWRLGNLYANPVVVHGTQTPARRDLRHTLPDRRHAAVDAIALL